MKRLTSYFVVFLLGFNLLGCISTANLPNLASGFNELENGGKDFIELKDGTILEGEVTKNTLGMYLGKSTGSIFLNDKKYSGNEIMAFQKDQKYWRKTAYNDFNERIIKGKISGYRSELLTYNSTLPKRGRSFDYYLFYIQKGEKGKVVAYELKVLKKMIEDYPPAVEEYTKYKALSKKEKKKSGQLYLDDVIKTYNKQ